MLTTDDPPPTRSKWTVQELDGAKVHFELVYANVPWPITGTGTFFVKRQYRDGTMLVYVEVLHINWDSGDQSLDRFPLDQERVDQIERHPEEGQNKRVFRLLS